MTIEPPSKSTVIPGQGPLFQTFLRSNKIDEKGRIKGYIIGLREVNGLFYAWVQCGRMLPDLSDFSDFGATQRSKGFKSMQSAKDWAYTEAKRRLANLNRK